MFLCYLRVSRLFRWSFCAWCYTFVPLRYDVSGWSPLNFLQASRNPRFFLSLHLVYYFCYQKWESEISFFLWNWNWKLFELLVQLYGMGGVRWGKGGPYAPSGREGCLRGENFPVSSGSLNGYNKVCYTLRRPVATMVYLIFSQGYNEGGFSNKNSKFSNILQQKITFFQIFVSKILTF